MKQRQAPQARPLATSAKVRACFFLVGYWLAFVACSGKLVLLSAIRGSHLDMRRLGFVASLLPAYRFGISNSRHFFHAGLSGTEWHTLPFRSRSST